MIGMEELTREWGAVLFILFGGLATAFLVVMFRSIFDKDWFLAVVSGLLIAASAVAVGGVLA
ncbi:hypothetical protein [Agromyces mariniharenae]|uniref:Uncharacterized protein n=1 Tax=Agromyces mariniharenae TaxID=2604423 RepID=A0A5S4V8G9_9MICO|nr:hypothetical protein [Agromyces mariniharenae]TYL50405.1 hypothetical protein FYC51_14455 [Agromyces mariniharenae]